MLERIATYNLSESLLWNGALDEALRLARRSLSLQRGHGEGAIQFDQLLIARIYAARGDRSELAELLAELGTAELSDADRQLVTALGCVDPSTPVDVWTRCLVDADSLGIDLQLELAFLAGRAGKLQGEVGDRLRKRAAEHPIWSRRAGF